MGGTPAGGIFAQKVFLNHNCEWLQPLNLQSFRSINNTIVNKYTTGWQKSSQINMFSITAVRNFGVPIWGM
jgi:hypothetical protein